MDTKKASLLIIVCSTFFVNSIFAANKIGDSPFASITVTLPFGQHLLTNTPYVAHYNIHVVNGFSVLWNHPGYPSLPPMIKVAPGTTCPNVNNTASNVSINGDCQLNLSFTAAQPMPQGLHGGPWVYFGSGLISPDQPINIQDVALSPANLSVTEDTSQAHLSYKKLIVRNIGNSQVVLGDILSSIPDKVVVCDTTGASSDDCFYHSTCETGTALVMHTGSCYIWIKAKKDSNSPIAVHNTPGAITINATPVALQNKTEMSPPVVVNVKYNQDLYVGGRFDKTADNSTLLNGIARWDGTSWHQFTDSNGNVGLDKDIYTFTEFAGDLYVGGWFQKTGGSGDTGTTTLNRIAHWNGTSWQQLKDSNNNIGLSSGVTSLAPFNDRLYVGGWFTKNGGSGATGTTTLNRIASWNGAWHPLKDSNENIGLSYAVDALTFLNGTLYVGGRFFRTGGSGDIGTTTLNRIAAWSGTWQQLKDSNNNIGLNDTVYSLVGSNGTLYVGGRFLSTGESGDIGTTTLNRITAWNGTWQQLKDSNGNVGLDSYVRSLTVLNGKELYVGGNFSKTGGSGATGTTTLNRIASWNETWHPLKDSSGNIGLDSGFGALTPFGQNLYLGGWFTKTGGFGATGTTTLNRVASWTGAWQQFKSAVQNIGLNGAVYALFVAPSLTIEK